MIIDIIAAVVRVVRGLLEIIIGLFALDWHTFSKGITDVVEGLFWGIWHIIKGVFLIILGVVEGFVGGVIGWFKWLFNELVGHSIVWDIINGIWDAFKTIIGLGKWIWDHVLKPVWDMFKKLWTVVKAVISVWWTVIKTIWSGLATAGQWIWDHVLKPIFDMVVKVWTGFIKPAFQAWWAGIKVIWAGLATAGKWIWNHVLHPIFKKVEEIWNKFIKPAFKFWWTALKNEWAGLKKAAAWIWDNVLHPVFKKIQEIWNKYIAPAFKFWWQGLKNDWTALKKAATWIWDNVLQPVFNKVRDLWLQHVKPELGKWWDRIKGAWNFLTTIGTWFKNNVMDKVFSAVKTGWEDIKDWLHKNKDLLLGPMRGIANGIIKAVNTVINGLNTISDVLPGPINWHIGTIDTLAQGGMMRRHANRGFQTQGARAIVGEGKKNYPEFVIPTDPTHRSRAKGLMLMAMGRMGIKNGADLRGILGDTPKDIANVTTGHPKDAMAAVPKFGFGGWLTHTVSGATNWFKDKAKSLIAKAVNPILNAAESTVKGVGWSAIEPPPLFGIQSMRDWINDANTQYNDANTKAQDKLAGGPAVRKALAFAKKQVGDPYHWGGVGPDSYDCSGFQSAITNVLRGQPPYSRVGTTDTFPWTGFTNGHGPAKGYTIGSTKSYAGGVGHMAGTLGGINVESRGGTGVIVGSGARGFNDPGFNTHAYLKLAARGAMVKGTRHGTALIAGENYNNEAIVPLDRLNGNKGGNKTYNFYGDLSFPNITDPADAEKFIKNLEILAETA